MIKKVLIANRGEIACRIIKTAKKLGIKTVAVYSAADKQAQHVQLAEEAVFLGVTLQESYLNAEKIIVVAQQTKAQAIHPGYGFLAENPDFAQRCVAANLIFVGPSAEVIRLMGHKDAAKRVVAELGIPLLPGYHGDNQGAQFLLKEAEKMGFPVLLKAAGGGGGKGMRIVESAANFEAQLSAAKRESLSAFGFDKIIIEKYLENPRHIEVQVAADGLGHVVHLFERDCSIQRRYQKIVEEAPAVCLSETLKKKLYAAAIKITQHIQYQGVGTIECLVEGDAFYFMEMNTRLQVEHPVTELITQQDLVEWQFKIANNEALPLTQSEIVSHGHAIELRLCAEDPDNAYLPSAGKIRYLRWPTALRVDTGIAEGDVITIHYDSLMAKLITFGETRLDAIHQLQQGVDQTEIIGVTTNRTFLKKIIALPDYQAGKLSTQFIPQHQALLFTAPMPQWDVILPLASLFVLKNNAVLSEGEDVYSPWRALCGFQLNQAPHATLYFYVKNDEVAVTLTQDHCHSRLFKTAVSFSDVKYNAENHQISAVLAGNECAATFIKLENNLHIFYAGWHDVIQLKGDFLAEETDAHETCIRAPIPGSIVAVLVKEGEPVSRAQPLVVMEAMKMEHTIVAPKAGTVHQVHFKVKDQVEEGMELMKLSFD